MVQWFIAAAIVLLFIYIVIVCFLAALVLRPRTYADEAVYAREIERGRITPSFFESVKKEVFLLPSQYGYALHCMLLFPEEADDTAAGGTNTAADDTAAGGTNTAADGTAVGGTNTAADGTAARGTKAAETRGTKAAAARGETTAQAAAWGNRLAVFAHGYSASKKSGLTYARELLACGIPVLLYDERNHGENDKCFTSMGFYETQDLLTVLAHCRERFGASLRLLLYGESMGAATVLNTLRYDTEVSAVIADCPYSDLYTLCCHQVGTLHHLPVKLFVPVAACIVRLFGGFWLREVCPREGVMQAKQPILLIHGAQDTFVPTAMSVEMSKCGTGPRELLLVEGAGHAQSIRVCEEEYRARVRDFIARYFPKEPA